MQPINNLRIGVFYDDGGEKFGGDIVYVYNFGIPQKRESKVAFSPDLFAPVVREYSQRIISTTTLQIVEVPTLTLFTTTTIPARVQRTTLGLGFITVSMPITVATATIMDSTTMAGMTTRMITETPTMTATRMASVHFTLRAGGNTHYYIATSQFKYLLTLPSVITRPLSITTIRHFERGVANELRIVETNIPSQVVGMVLNVNNVPTTNTLVIAEGSEDFVSVAITLTNTTTTEVAAVITETTMTLSAATITRMTNTLMPTLTTTMTISAMMITTPTLTLYQIITTGIPTTNIGAAKVDSPLPPSFPPLSFPPSSPIMVSYGLAKNGDSWIPAMAVPAFAPFPRHSRAGGNPPFCHFSICA